MKFKKRIAEISRDELRALRALTVARVKLIDSEISAREKLVGYLESKPFNSRATADRPAVLLGRCENCDNMTWRHASEPAPAGAELCALCAAEVQPCAK